MIISLECRRRRRRQKQRLGFDCGALENVFKRDDCISWCTAKTTRTYRNDKSNRIKSFIMQLAFVAAEELLGRARSRRTLMLRLPSSSSATADQPVTSFLENVSYQLCRAVGWWTQEFKERSRTKKRAHTSLHQQPVQQQQKTLAVLKFQVF